MYVFKSVYSLTGIVVFRGRRGDGLGIQQGKRLAGGSLIVVPCARRILFFDTAILPLMCVFVVLLACIVFRFAGRWLPRV